MAPFAFSHTFNNVSTAPCHKTTPFYTDETKWELAIGLEDHDGKNFLVGFLYGTPRAEVVDDSLFIITADYKATIKSHKLGKTDCVKEKKDVVFSKGRKGDCYGGSRFLFQPHTVVKPPSYFISKDDSMTIDIVVDVISVDEIQDDTTVEFENPNLEDSDVILNLGTMKLYSHSQILSFNSLYFRRRLAALKIEESRRIYTGKKIKTENNKMELAIDIKDVESSTVSTFLSIIYCPRRRIIDKDNVKDLLTLAVFFDCKMILNACEEFLFALPEESNPPIPIEEITVLAWQFSLEYLKIVALDGFQKYNQFEKICKLDSFNNLPVECQKDLQEKIIKKLVSYFGDKEIM